MSARNVGFAARRLPLAWIRAALLGAMLGGAACRAGGEPVASEPAPPAVAPRPFDGDPRFSPQRILAATQFLASDELEGRAPGERGGLLAVEYLASRAKALGLEPCAEGGSFLQPVPLVGVTTQPGSAIELAAPSQQGVALRWLEDFVGTDETLAASVEFEAPVVFVGYGIVAPEQNWNDYDGADVRGKVVMILANEPGRNDPNAKDLFAGEALTYYGRWTYKYEEATRQGARGALLAHSDEAAGYGWTVVRSSWGREHPYPRRGEEHALSLASWIRGDAAREAVERAGLSWDSLAARAEQRRFRAVDTGLTARVRLRSATRDIPTHNVLALLPGADPERAKEAVVYTAHHDHLGVGDPENGDAIYNGAVDNASGCAALLEIARAFAEAPARPPRSILFAWVTAEEGGLRGSEHFAQHPTFPRERIVANLNLDGIPLDGDPTQIVALGWDRSTLRPLVESTAISMGMSVAPDRDPRQGYFFRSDHFNFAKIGVPALSLNAGFAYYGKPESWGHERYEDYRKNRYHRPGDAFDPSWDGTAPAKLAEFAFRLGEALARGADLPTYLPGDPFRAAQPRRSAR